jgi:hypothetical protein
VEVFGELNRYLDEERAVKRGAGRHEGVGNKGREVLTGKVDTRLNAQENSMLDELSRRNGVSRSAIMRKALVDFYKFNSLEE